MQRLCWLQISFLDHEQVWSKLMRQSWDQRLSFCVLEIIHSGVEEFYTIQKPHYGSLEIGHLLYDHTFVKIFLQFSNKIVEFSFLSKNNVDPSNGGHSTIPLKWRVACLIEVFHKQHCHDSILNLTRLWTWSHLIVVLHFHMVLRRRLVSTSGLTPQFIEWIKVLDYVIIRQSNIRFAGASYNLKLNPTCKMDNECGSSVCQWQKMHSHCIFCQ